mmetsp:Transcript_23570/g.40326  ORF Transcript_23570/g.40326 Transcript_23570/m.40326 type:complete len:226 (-) Transcript_23570:251-928(-)
MSCCCCAVISRPPASSSATASASSPIVSSFLTKPVSYCSSTLPKRCFSALIASAICLGGTSGEPSSSFLSSAPPTPAMTMLLVARGDIFSLSRRWRASGDSIRSSWRSSVCCGSSFLSSSSCTRFCSLLSTATAPLPCSPAACACCRLASRSCSSASSIRPCRASPATLPSMITGVGDAKMSLITSAAACIRVAISAFTASLISFALTAFSPPSAMIWSSRVKNP